MCVDTQNKQFLSLFSNLLLCTYKNKWLSATDRAKYMKNKTVAVYFNSNISVLSQFLIQILL